MQSNQGEITSMAAPSVGALATSEQRLMEERAIAIYASPEIGTAKLGTLALFRADRNARLPDQDTLMRRSVDEHYFHASLISASETPRSPRFVWTLALAHRWMGLRVPGSRFGQDNTDNVYRVASVDQTLTYQISGRFASQRPCDFSICALPAHMGENIAADVLAILRTEDIDIGPDGRFSITIDETPTRGRRGHLCIAGAKVLFVRDTLADWSVERPSELCIERTNGPTIDDFDAARAPLRAAELGALIARFFLEHVQHGMFETLPANRLTQPIASAGRGGLTTQAASLGCYELGDDEALIITADRLGARYVGIQIVDMWMISYDYAHHTSSLNHFQAIADGDGRYRWVISPRDPGVFNWLDGSGHAAGAVLIRWQHPRSFTQASTHVSTEIVKQSELRAHLPSDTRYVDQAGRTAQQAQRLRDYMCRIRQ
jgi:hypothetical protein